MLANILWFLAIGGLFFWMMRGGGGCCGGHDHGSHDDHGVDNNHSHHHDDEASNDATKQQLTANTDNEKQKDPVCGMEAGEGGPESHYNGHLYHFCSDHCRKVFDLNPAKFV